MIPDSIAPLRFDVGDCLRELLAAAPTSPRSRAMTPPSEPALVAMSSPSWMRLTGLQGEIGCGAYPAYARLAAAPSLSRDRAAAIAGDRAATLQWYLCEHAAGHSALRLPLSREDQAYLLDPERWDGLGFAVPRIVLWQALFPQTTAPLLAEGATETALAFWWITEGSLGLRVEDCLVPDAYRARLSASADDGSGLSVLEAGLAASIPYLLERPDDRRRRSGWLGLALCREPGFAACWDRELVLDIYADVRGPLAELLASYGYDPREVAQLRDRFHLRAAETGFDTDRWCFVTRDDTGHRRFAPPAPASPALGTHRADVRIVGPVRQRSGLAHAARMSIETLRRAGVQVGVDNVSYGFPSPDDATLMTDLGPQGRAGATLFHVNPNMLPLVVAAGAGSQQGRRASYVFWELDRPALSDFLGLDLVDEIWTASRFVQRTYQPYHAGVVDCVGLAMPPPPILDRTEMHARLRASLGLTPDAIVFLSVFDGLSYIERKNPLAAIRAFQDAFPDRPDLALLLKTHNRPLGYAGPQGAAWEAVDSACRADGRIRLLTQSVPHADILGMIAGADAYVSLHRSEGWGLGPAEAMALGTPTIVTSYGGTEDFCDDDTAYRVSWTRRPVLPTEYVHVDPGQAWAEPDHGSAVAAFRAIVSDPQLRDRRAAAARGRIADVMSFDAVGRRYTRALERLLARS